LPAIKKLADQDPDAVIDFVKIRLKRFLKLNPDKEYTTDELLIDYIHDQKSAGIVSQLIDLKKYGKEYAEKVGRFY
jgi:hypothetical protein